MNTSQKQFNSNFVLDSYLIENNRKSVSRMIDLAIWTTLFVLILLFVAMLVDAYQNDLIDRNYNLPFTINFIIAFGLFAIGMPKLKSNNWSLNKTQLKPVENSIKVNVNKQVSDPLISFSKEQKNETTLAPITTKTKAPQVNLDYNFNTIHFGQNMQYNGLYAAKPAV